MIAPPSLPADDWLRPVLRAAGTAVLLLAGGACATDDGASGVAAVSPGSGGTSTPNADGRLNLLGLVGLDNADIRSLLGPPTFVRQDGPAQLWHYAARNCTLDLFLYQDPQNAMRVRHFEVRPGETANSGQRCLETVMATRQRRV